MASQEKIISALDIGTTKTKLLVASVINNELASIIGVGMYPCNSLKKGVVVDLEGVSSSIVKSKEEAERMSGKKITSVFLNIGGTHVSGFVNRGLVAISRPGREIQIEDIKRVNESVKAVILGPNQQIIHMIPRQYIVDGQEGIKDPLRMSGLRLELEAYIATGATTVIDNLKKSVTNANLKIDGVVLQSLSSAYAILSEEEKEFGVMVVDIGGSTTDIAIFVDGSLAFSSVLPFGSQNITKDISAVLKTSPLIAEELKINYGFVFTEKNINLFNDYEVNYLTSSGGLNLSTSASTIGKIITARVEEIIEAIKLELLHSGYVNLLSSGIVLTGGGALLKNFPEKIQEMLQIPAKVGYPKIQDVTFSSFNSPIFSTAVGLLNFVLDSTKDKANMRNVSGSVWQKTLDFFKYFFE